MNSNRISKIISVLVCIAALFLSQRPVRVNYEPYTPDSPAGIYCEAEVTALCNFGKETSSYGTMTSTTGQYCFATLTDGSIGAVKVRDLASLAAQAASSAEGVYLFDTPVTLRGKTAEMPYFGPGLDAFLEAGPDSLQSVLDKMHETNSQLEDFTLLDTTITRESEVKEHRELIFLAALVIGIVSAGSLLKDLLTDFFRKKRAE